MNPGNIWTQKVPLNGKGEDHMESEINGQRHFYYHFPLSPRNNLCGLSFQNTRIAMVLTLCGLTTVETTKVAYPLSELERLVL